MALNRVSSFDTTGAAGAGTSIITPENLTIAAQSIAGGVAVTGAVIVGAVAPVPATVAVVTVAGCLYAANRMENDLPIIPSFGNNAPTEPVTVQRPTVDVTPVSA